VSGIATLVVEDEQLASEAHVAYLERLPAFTLAGVARTAQEALAALRDSRVDLVLLDVNLPDGNGLDVVRRMRAAGHAADVIAVTANRDLAAVRRAVHLGVVGYLLKPFGAANFTAKLEQYAAFRRTLTETEVESQADVDRLLTGMVHRERLPAGLSAETLDAVVRLLTESARSATEVADATGVSRVTARRYLEHLADTGAVRRAPRYGGTGRPTVEYTVA
jgi:response regulator of citrate/malate metabolism